MSRATDIRDALGDQLANVAGLQVHRRPATSITPPAAIILRGGWTPYADVDGSADFTFGVLIATQLGKWDKAAQDADDLTENAVSQLVADQDLGGAACGVHVSQVSGEAIRAIGGTDYATCEITVEVIT